MSFASWLARSPLRCAATGPADAGRRPVAGGAKQGVRAQAVARAAAHTRAARRAAGTRICAHLRTLPELHVARAVAGYCALPDEACVDAVLAEVCRSGRRLCLPRFSRSRGVYTLVAVPRFPADLVAGHYGIREPRPGLRALAPRSRRSRRLAWLVPGVAFSPDGGRLGRGRGYYDRLMAGAEGFRIGIAFSWQLLAGIPVEAHDVRMHVLVTERGVFRCGATGAGTPRCPPQPVKGSRS